MTFDNLPYTSLIPLQTVEIHAVCDPCENNISGPGSFNPDISLGEIETGVIATCQTMADSYNLDDLDQDSFNCTFASFDLLFCCGDGIPCIGESITYNTCQLDNNCKPAEDFHHQNGSPTMAPTMMESLEEDELCDWLAEAKEDVIKEAEEMCQACINEFKDALSCEEEYFYDFCSGSGIGGHGHALFFLIGLSLYFWFVMM